MEEHEYHATYHDVNPLECPFERAVLHSCTRCSRAVRLYIAEREGVGCRAEEAHTTCVHLFDALQKNARFALKLENPDAPLPHGKRIKIECGGLHGIDALTAPDGEASPPVEDAFAAIQRALEAFGDLDTLPYQRLMPHIVHYQSRPRRRG